MPKQWLWIGGGVALLVVIGLAIAAEDPVEPDEPPAVRRTVAIPTALLGPKLALISADCTNDGGYITCQGFVKNISGSAIENVTAVAVFTDATGKPLSSDTALVEYDPLLPDQESPFKVLTRVNPAFTNWRIEFKELLGGQIKTRDDSH